MRHSVIHSYNPYDGFERHGDSTHANTIPIKISNQRYSKSSLAKSILRTRNSHVDRLGQRFVTEAGPSLINIRQNNQS